jgi:hypothetical protein
MNSIHFEIKGRKAIEKMGMVYTDTDINCREHVLSCVPIKIDVRDQTNYSLNKIEKDLDIVFRKLLKSELLFSKIKKLHSVVWDRIYIIGDEWNVRKFEARYWIRILGEDAPGTATPVCLECSGG